MKKQTIGLILFWIGVTWTFAWGIFGAIHRGECYAQVLTPEEFNQSIWAITGIIMPLWGFAPLLGSIVAGIGLLLRSGAKTTTMWKYGVGLFLGVFVCVRIGAFGHYPPLYAIGGTLIMLFFFGVLWFWAKERKTLERKTATTADLKMVGYVFLFLAVWFTCGISSEPWYKAFEGQHPSLGGADPIAIQITFVLGWLFLFMGHYKSRKQIGQEEQ